MARKEFAGDKDVPIPISVFCRLLPEPRTHGTVYFWIKQGIRSRSKERIKLKAVNRPSGLAIRWKDYEQFLLEIDQ